MRGWRGTIQENERRREKLKATTDSGDFVKFRVKEMKVLADEIDRFLEVVLDIAMIRIVAGNKYLHCFLFCRRSVAGDQFSQYSEHPGHHVLFEFHNHFNLLSLWIFRVQRKKRGNPSAKKDFLQEIIPRKLRKLSKNHP
ncbi:MAG: hypothetical protein J6V11_04210 [Alphaproteobacteria bacterium]|nr:hypothetical protein [Alphaproteobacteria bacterium]